MAVAWVVAMPRARTSGECANPPGGGLSGLLTQECGGKGEGGVQSGAMFPAWATEWTATFITENAVMLRHEDEATSGRAESASTSARPGAA